MTGENPMLDHDPENFSMNVTDTLRPLEVLAMYLVRGLQGSFCDWVPNWAWELYGNEARKVVFMLESWGVTDQDVGRLERYQRAVSRPKTEAKNERI